MFVSIGVLCYNNSSTVVQTLDSIKGQSHNLKEVIIIDDHSKDNSVETINEWLNQNGKTLDVTFIKNEQNAGIVAGIKKVIGLAKGDIVCFIAADDVYEFSRIENIAKAFNNNADEFGLLYSDAKIIDINGDILSNSYLEYFKLKAPGSGNLYDRLLENNFIPALSLAYRKKVLLEIKDDIDSGLFFEDYQMTILSSRFYKALFLETNDVCYRVHGTSTMNTRGMEVMRDKIYFLLSELSFLPKGETRSKLKKNVRKELIQFLKFKQGNFTEKDLALAEKANTQRFYFPSFFIKNIGKNKLLNSLLYRYFNFYAKH